MSSELKGIIPTSTKVIHPSGTLIKVHILMMSLYNQTAAVDNPKANVN